MMLIEHTIKRAKGSKHTIGATTYDFQPNKDGAHVAEVKDDAHIKRFLSIDSFCIHGGKEKAPAPAKAPAPVAPPAPPAGTNDANTGDTGENTITPLEDMARDELVAIHQETFGKKPHHKWDEAKIIAAIREVAE